jgi:hypothetical protein
MKINGQRNADFLGMNMKKYVYSIVVNFHPCLCVDLMSTELCSVLLLQQSSMGSKSMVSNVLDTGTKSREKDFCGPRYK